MKKPGKGIIAAMIAVLLMAALTGCQKGEPVTKWDRRPMVMAQGDIYMDTNKKLQVEIEESEILGNITASVDASEMPARDGESNFGCIGSPYALVEGGLAVLIGDEWVLFEMEK